jgi:hypothetical protein
MAKWTEFGPDWQQMLDQARSIEYLKMAEAARLRGQFDSWTEERRGDRIRLAYAVIEKYVSLRASCIIDLEAYYRIFNWRVIDGPP